MGKSIDINWIIDNWRHLSALPEFNTVIDPIIESKKCTYKSTCRTTAYKLTDFVNTYLIENYIKEFLEKDCHLYVEFTDKKRKLLEEGLNSCKSPDLLVQDSTGAVFLAEVKKCSPYQGILNYVLNGIYNYNYKTLGCMNLHGALKAFYYNELEDSIYYVEFEDDGILLSLKTNKYGQPSICKIKSNCGLRDSLLKEKDLL